MPEALEPYTGYLRVAAAVRHGRTTLSESVSTGAYKPSRLVEAEGSGQPVLYLMNPGGGFVDGDRYRMELEAGPGAELAVTSQSATKVYRTPRDCVRSETAIIVASGALLELLPDPVIAYENARYVQQTRIHLEPGAAVVCADAWTPGWSPAGTRFAYERIDALTELHVGGELQAYDRLALVPARNGAEWDDFDGFTHYGSLLAVVDGTDAAAQERLHDELADRFDACAGVRFGLTRLPVPGGLMLRVLADSTELLQTVIGAAHGHIRTEWLGKAPLRIRK